MLYFFRLKLYFFRVKMLSSAWNPYKQCFFLCDNWAQPNRFERLKLYPVGLKGRQKESLKWYFFGFKLYLFRFKMASSCTSSPPRRSAPSSFTHRRP